MGVVKILIEKNEVRFLNAFNDLFSSLFNIHIFYKYYFPKYEVNHHILKKNSNHIFINRANEYLKKIIESITIIYWKGRKWKGTYWPSKWKWYHRHGYWATRKKLLDFDKYRPYRYHEVKGYGKPKLKFWQDYSYYRPLKQTTKFW
ncbi:conserved Plasmodium protein, unknown function [Plasmodium gallinaceum]|uniref:Uncharacterized protein n=1 Tax=Plasmodium gallinaceum TaxID=5849 RepID=A0A1J1GY45_PLAGA|nr:conserved Plasmodium protein, unknown function [Plasmodium gallinaceum]CRG96200.1 conserved Plasmodium protein, unknown function [Plasmodium gallinaceum]